MAAFVVIKKGDAEDNEYQFVDRAITNHPLPFLDLLAMTFSDERSLLQFLGFNPDEFEIMIYHRHESTIEYLPLYFDARELFDICNAIYSEEIKKYGKNLHWLAVAYMNDSMLSIRNNTEISDEIVEMVVRLVDFGNSSLNAKALLNAYAKIRKAYQQKRSQEERFKPVGTVTESPKLSDLYEQYSSIILNPIGCERNDLSCQQRAYLVMLNARAREIPLTNYEETFIFNAIQLGNNYLQGLPADTQEKLTSLLAPAPVHSLGTMPTVTSKNGN